MSATTITVESVSPSKTAGKFSIKDASGAFWDAWEVGNSLQAGKSYEVEFTSREYNGKTYRTIKKATAQSNGHATQAAAPMPTANSLTADRGGVPPHVSNWVAHAIAAGKIKDAAEMVHWAQWAYQAGLSMSQRPSDMAARQEGPQPRREPVFEGEDAGGFP